MIPNETKLKLDDGNKVTIKYFISRCLDEQWWCSNATVSDYSIIETYFAKTEKDENAIVNIRINMLDYKVDSTYSYINMIIK